MSEIVINPAIIEKYLINIVWRLNGVKLDSVAMDFTGNASGLNSFAYAYCRISNLLVSYRDLVRSDIHCVCEGVSALLYEDGSIADSISNDSIDGLVSFGEDLMNRVEAIGAVSLPSIYTSSFTLNYQDMSFFENVLTSQVSELCDNLFCYKESIKSLCETNAFMGDTAESIKAYWRDVHIPIVDALLALSVEIVERYSEFVFNLDVLIDEQNDCNIPQSILGIYIEMLTSINGRLEIEAEEILNRIREYSSSYSEFSSSDPDVQLVTNALLQSVSTIECLAETIYEYENSQADITKGFIDNAVEEIADLFNGLQDVSIMCYTTNAIEDISGYDFVCELSASVDTDHLRQRTVELYIDASEGDYRNLSNSQIEYIQDYVDIVYANRYSDCENVVQLRAVNLGQIEIYIGAYELLNPDQAVIVNNYLSPIVESATSENGYMQDYDNIRYILYTSEEPYRSGYIRAAEDISLHDLDYDGLAHYNNMFNRIDLNLEELRNQNYPYITFFHEWAHGIDDIAERFGSASSSNQFVNSERKTIKDLVVEELTANIRNTLENINESNNLGVDDAEVQIVLDHLTSSEYIYNNQYPSDWSYEMRELFDDVRNYYGYYSYDYENNELTHDNHTPGLLSEEIENEFYYIPLSDVFAGLTNNEIGGLTGHYFDDPEELRHVHMVEGTPYSDAQIGEFLSNYNYWYDWDGRTDGISHEFFAEYSSYQILGVDRCIESYRSITPNSATLVDECYRQLAGGEPYEE